MKKRFLLAMCLALVCGGAVADNVGPDLQAVSVNISCPGAYRSVQGSGTIVLVDMYYEVNDFPQLVPTAWVLTAEHVVHSLRRVQEVIGPDGTTKKQVSYGDAEIVQERVSEGRGVGERRYDARVVSVDPRRDIALLRVRLDGEFKQGAVFYLDSQIPKAGVEIFHCGAPGGKEIGGTCSLTDGVVSRNGARIPEFGGAEHGVFDQVTCPALGGSSGGLVALREDARVVGMITLGLRGGDSFHWMVPVRSILEYADEAGVRWVFDPGVERPSKEDIVKIPLELNPSGYAGSTEQVENKGVIGWDLFFSPFSESYLRLQPLISR